MKELGLVLLVAGFLIFAVNALAYIGVNYGCIVFWTALSVLFMFVGATLIFIFRNED